MVSAHRSELIQLNSTKLSQLLLHVNIFFMFNIYHIYLLLFFNVVDCWERASIKSLQNWIQLHGAKKDHDVKDSGLKKPGWGSI